MTTLKTLEMALEALEAYLNATDSDQDVKAYDLMEQAVTALRQQIALEKMAENARELGLDYDAKPDERLMKMPDEPVAWMYPSDYEKCLTSEHVAEVTSVECTSVRTGEKTTIPLYTRPQPAAQWVGLTDEEIEDACWTEVDRRLTSFARDIEAKLREKNGGNT